MMCAPADLPHPTVPVSCGQCRQNRIEIAQLRAQLALTQISLRTMRTIANVKEDHLAEARREIGHLEAEHGTGHLEGRATVDPTWAGMPQEIPAQRESSSDV